MKKVAIQPVKKEPKGKRGVSPIYLDDEDPAEGSNVVHLRSNGRPRIAFGWYGGKFSHLDWLLPLLPKCHHKNTSRAGMSGVVSRWLGGVEALDEIAQRFLRMQIENRPAKDVIRLYDSPDTLFYCDPPYLHATRGDSKAYGFEMDEDQHREFAGVLKHCRAKIAVSGYDHPVMEELFPASKWLKTTAPEKTNHATKGTRQEVLWTNYEASPQENLFK